MTQLTRSEHLLNTARSIVMEMPGYHTMSTQEIHQRVTWVHIQLLRAFIDTPSNSNKEEG